MFVLLEAARRLGGTVKIEQSEALRLRTDSVYKLLGVAIKLRAKAEESSEEVRFETAPAKQGQCDWADFGTVSEEGQIQALSLFVMVLGYSRHTFAQFTTSMDESSLQREHHAAFVDFGGVPSEIVYDNIKTVTTGRNAESDPIWQRSFADFAGRYGFTPKCARPYRAKTKGKVERTIGFIRRSFLAARTFTDITDANAQLKRPGSQKSTRAGMVPTAS